MTAPNALRPNGAPGFPGESYLDQCSPEVQRELRQFYSLLEGWLSINHNADGTHSGIRAGAVKSEIGYKEFGRDDFLGVSEAIQWTPSNFSASGAMTWAPTSGQQTYLRAARIGNLMSYSGQIVNSNVGGVASFQLLVKIPFVVQNDGVSSDFVGVEQVLGTVLYIDAGGARSVGVCLSVVDGKYISIQKADGTNWTITAGNNTTVIFSIFCPIKQNPL